MPEIGLGIGRERGTYQGLTREWLYWHDQNGNRYHTPQEVTVEQQQQLEQTQQQLQELLHRLQREHPVLANRPQTGSLGLQKQSLPPQAIYKSACADLVCVAAISNRQVFFPKWDVPDYNKEELTPIMFNVNR